MTSTIKVNNIQNQCGANIINENSNTITIGASGDTIALASGASQTGFGRTGTVDWQTSIQTSASFTAVNGQGFFIDTSSNVVTANLPAGTPGSIVAFKDYANNFDTNKLTISPNGSQKINNDTLDLDVTTEGESLTLVYADDTKGWLIVNDGNNDAGSQPKFVTATGGNTTANSPCGNFKIHTFTGPGTFQITCAGNVSGSNTLEYLVVAAGGGSARDNGGGAGAGGVRFFAANLPSPSPASPRNAPAGIAATVASFPIAVGSGGGPGSAKSPNSEPGDRGSNSTFSTITSTGGGGSTGDGQSASPNNPGGSGSGTGQGASGSGGTGNTPPVNPSQGSDGGGDAANPGGGGGGGGFMAVGSNRSGDTGGPGGVGGGFAPGYFGCSGVPSGGFRFFAGGGGGGSGQPGSGGAGSGGTGGGGAGGSGNGNPGNGGVLNSGGGAGGGGQAGEGAIGGSGIVIIRYKFQ